MYWISTIWRKMYWISFFLKTKRPLNKYILQEKNRKKTLGGVFFSSALRRNERRTRSLLKNERVKETLTTLTTHSRTLAHANARYTDMTS